MNYKMKVILSFIVSILLLQAGCKKEESTPTTPSQNASVVFGRLIDADYYNGITGASVVALGSIQTNAASDSTGNFTVPFGNLTSQYTAVLLITATGYYDTTQAVTIEAGHNLILPTIRLRRIAGFVVITNAAVKRAAQVAYVGNTASDIYISGVGALENSVITYEVRDSLGMPVAKLPRYGATFTINFYPNVHVGGGVPPKAIPNADSTDVNGQLHVSIVSGTEAGVVEVLTQVTVDSTKIITSQPVRISVHAGFPDQDHFTIMPSRFVFPSMDSYNEVPITVAVGDTFSNPVPTGWAVYFHSQAGIMQTGNADFQAYTNEKGLASVRLETVNPTPSNLPYYDPAYFSGRIGGEWLYVQTMGRNKKTIVDSVCVIWNQAPILVGMEGRTPEIDPIIDSALTMPAHGRTRYINMVVTDVNGNPLCDGTNISATVLYVSHTLTDLQFDVSGNVPTTIPIAGYCRWPGPGVTDFSLCVVDNSEGDMHGMVTLQITITSPLLANPWIKKYPVTVY